MSSSIPRSNSADPQTLIFFGHLPFPLHFSDGPIVNYLDFSSAFQQIPVPISVPTTHHIRYRELVQSPLSDSSGSQTSPVTLSPTNTTEESIAVPILIQSFDRLTLSESSRQSIRARITELELELRFLTLNITSQRSRAVLIINTVTDIAINAAESRYIPQIDHLRDLLRRSD